MEEETRTVLPAVALRGRTVLPSTVIHFDINRVRSVRAVENAMLKDQKVFLVTQRDSTVRETLRWRNPHRMTFTRSEQWR